MAPGLLLGARNGLFSIMAAYRDLRTYALLLAISAWYRQL